MDSRNTPWTQQKTWDQPATEEEIILDPLALEEEIILDQPLEEERSFDRPAPEEEERSFDQSALEEENSFDQSTPANQSLARPVRVEAVRQRPRGGLTRQRLLGLGLVALVLLSGVVGLLTHVSGSAAMETTTTRSHPSTPIATSTPLPIKTPLSTRAPVTTGQPTSLTPGPLILLNPGVVRQGSSVSVTGSGFDAKATIDLLLKGQASASPLASTFVQADKSGTFSGASLNVPTSLSSGPFLIQAQQRNSSKSAQAVGTVAGGMPQVKLGTQVAKPGDVLALSLHGFSPGEVINIYWNSLNGHPVATLQADGSGGVGQASVQVPFGAAGTNTFLFEGTKSQALAAAPVLLLTLYPSVVLSSYALQADNALSFTGSGFGPGERVFVYVNNPNDQPVAVLQTDAQGTFSKAGQFVIPFVLKGQQTLIFVGEQSRVPSTVSFTVLPYTPSIQPSTYGGFPGTTVSFYAAGFARNEVVHVYVGRTQNSMGTLVSCFRTDDKGNAGAAGSYVVPGNAQPGTLVFTLMGGKSGGIGTASMHVSAPPSPVQVPAQPPFTCPLDTTP